MSNEDILVILFPDATMTVTGSPEGLQKEMYQPGARFFAVNDNVPIGSICDFYAKGFNHRKFREIVPQ